jgi:hypothetical protein
MGNNQSVNAVSTVASPVTALAFLHHAMATFVPSTSDFLTGFTTSTATWMFESPASGLGLVAELTPSTWQSRLKSMGAVSTEPIWRWVNAHYKQLKVADATGARDPLVIPNKVYIGRRTRAVVSVQTVEFSTNTAGTVRVRVNPAKYIHDETTPAGALADVTITADGALTVTQLAQALDDALTAISGFAAQYTIVAALGVVTITSLDAGYPLIIEVTPSSPGPTMIQVITTANIAGNYELDLDDIQAAAEFGAHLDPPTRRFYWLTDIQADDVVSLEGLAWVDDQGSDETPTRPYVFCPWSMTGDSAIKIGANFVGNFDPSATDSISQLAMEALTNEGYSRGFITDHDRWEFTVGMILGRVIGYLPGQVSFTSKVLYGSVNDAISTPRDYGDNASLANERNFCWYDAEGPRGAFKYGATPSGSFIDRVWLADYATYLCELRLTEWMQLNDIIAYSDDYIEAARSVVAGALAELPAVNAATINVTFYTRAQVTSNDIATRVYPYFASFADTNGIINRIGTLENPITNTLTDA